MAARSAHAASFRMVVTLFALLSFTAASYLTQTHIHGTPVVAEKLTQTAKDTPVKDHDKYPPAEDPSNCPICQEILHAGAYVAPNIIAALPPTLVAMTIALVLDTKVAVRKTSHSWRGRGPPHAA